MLGAPELQRLAFIDQYIQNLRQYRAIAIDVGDQDNLKVDTGKLHDVLTNYGIKHDRDRLRYTHEQCRGSLPRKRDAIFQPNAVIRNGEALTRASDLTSRHSTEGA